MEQTKNIAYQPTDGLSYYPSEAKYWDPEALDKEIRRTFEICHGCRLCFKYCDSFPSLFSSIDGKDGDVRQITAAETAKVMDSCFQCNSVRSSVPTPSAMDTSSNWIFHVWCSATLRRKQSVKDSACAIASSAIRTALELRRARVSVSPTWPIASACIESSWRRFSAFIATSCFPTLPARPSSDGLRAP